MSNELNNFVPGTETAPAAPTAVTTATTTATAAAGVPNNSSQVPADTARIQHAMQTAESNPTVVATQTAQASVAATAANTGLLSTIRNSSNKNAYPDSEDSDDEDEDEHKRTNNKNAGNAPANPASRVVPLNPNPSSTAANTGLLSTIRNSFFPTSNANNNNNNASSLTSNANNNNASVQTNKTWNPNGILDSDDEDEGKPTKKAHAANNSYISPTVYRDDSYSNDEDKSLREKTTANPPANPNPTSDKKNALDFRKMKPSKNVQTGAAMAGAYTAAWGLCNLGLFEAAVSPLVFSALVVPAAAGLAMQQLYVHHEYNRYKLNNGGVEPSEELMAEINRRSLVMASSFVTAYAASQIVTHYALSALAQQLIAGSLVSGSPLEAQLVMMAIAGVVFGAAMVFVSAMNMMYKAHQENKAVDWKAAAPQLLTAFGVGMLTGMTMHAAAMIPGLNSAYGHPMPEFAASTLAVVGQFAAVTPFVAHALASTPTEFGENYAAVPLKDKPVKSLIKNEDQQSATTASCLTGCYDRLKNLFSRSSSSSAAASVPATDPSASSSSSSSVRSQHMSLNP